MVTRVFMQRPLDPRFCFCYTGAKEDLDFLSISIINILCVNCAGVPYFQEAFGLYNCRSLKVTYQVQYVKFP
jgi:hypothetical protein